MPRIDVLNGINGRIIGSAESARCNAAMAERIRAVLPDALLPADVQPVRIAVVVPHIRVKADAPWLVVERGSETDLWYHVTDHGVVRRQSILPKQYNADEAAALSGVWVRVGDGVPRAGVIVATGRTRPETEAAASRGRKRTRGSNGILTVVDRLTVEVRQANIPYACDTGTVTAAE